MAAAVAEWGHGKHGTAGGHAIAAAFDLLVRDRFLKSDPTSQTGFAARLHYLLERKGGAQALAAAGIRPRVGQLVDWLTGDVTARRDTREKVDRAYRQVRGRYVARWLKQQLKGAFGGRGARVSVEPLPPGAVAADHRRRQAQAGDRELSLPPSRWEELVTAWNVGDLAAMDDAWVDICDDQIGSDGALYYEVGHIGISL